MTEPKNFSDMIKDSGSLKGSYDFKPEWESENIQKAYEDWLDTFASGKLYVSETYVPKSQIALEEASTYELIRAARNRAAKIPIPLVGGGSDGRMYASALERIRMSAARPRVGLGYFEDPTSQTALPEVEEYVKVRLDNWMRQDRVVTGYLTVYLYEPLMKGVRGNTATPTLTRLIEKSVTKAFTANLVEQQGKVMSSEFK